MTVALITGVTGGLGRALAFEHDRHGGDLILVARNEMKLASLVADLQHQCPASRVATVTANFAKGHTAAQGRVLNVSSLAAFFPGPEQAEYFATKAYLT